MGLGRAPRPGLLRVPSRLLWKTRADAGPVCRRSPGRRLTSQIEGVTSGTAGLGGLGSLQPGSRLLLWMALQPVGGAPEQTCFLTVGPGSGRSRRRGRGEGGELGCRRWWGDMASPLLDPASPQRWWRLPRGLDCMTSLCPVVGKARRREGGGPQQVPSGWDPGRAGAGAEAGREQRVGAFQPHAALAGGCL